MSKRNPKLLVCDITERGHKISDSTSGQIFKKVSKDAKTLHAVICNFEIIGEAANRLPDYFKDRFQISTGTAFVDYESA